MTFKKIEKEFDENINLYPQLKFEMDRIRMAGGVDFKSFLKQSFIKYLQSEVERLEKSKKEKPSDKAYVYTGIEVDRYNQAISDQITHLQAQVKELES